MNIEIFSDSIGMRCENSGRSSNPQLSEYELDAKSKYFLTCMSCFWCASYLNGSNMIIRCPMCDNNEDGLLTSILDAMPISDY